MGRDQVRQDVREWTPLNASTRAWLLAALRVDAAPTPVDPATVDWSRLARRARSDGLAPLLHRHLQTNVSGAPDSFVEAMRRAYYQTVSVNHLRLTELQRIGRHLAANGVRLMALKGAALARTVYEDSGLRFMGDVDVTVPPDQAATAVASLVGAGYRRADEEGSAATDLHEEGWHVRLVADVRGRPLEIELHWPNRRRVLVTQLARLDLDALWETAVPLDAPANLWQPSPPFTLLHLCLHLGLQHRFTDLGLRSLVDVDRLIRGTSAAEWKELPRLARRARARHVTFFVLHLAEQLLGTPLPRDVMKALAPDTARRRAFEHTLPHAAIVNRQRVFYGANRRRWRYLTSDGRFDMALGFWQELFPGRSYLATYYQNASRHRVVAYALWHPVHALLRAGRRRWRERQPARRPT